MRIDQRLPSARDSAWPFRAFIDCGRHRPHFFLQVPSIVLNAFLVARGLVCAAANLTTNELMRPSRFGYLADTRDDTFLNPFDRGPAANCLQFWRPSRSPDWGSAYGELIEVCQRIACADICTCTGLLADA